MGGDSLPLNTRIGPSSDVNSPGKGYDSSERGWAILKGQAAAGSLVERESGYITGTTASPHLLQRRGKGVGEIKINNYFIFIVFQVLDRHPLGCII